MSRYAKPVILAEGREDFRKEAAAKSYKTVSLKTTTAQYDLAYLIRNDEDKQVRIATRISSRFARSDDEDPTSPYHGKNTIPDWVGTQPRWAILAVPRETILSMEDATSPSRHLSGSRQFQAVGSAFIKRN